MKYIKVEWPEIQEYMFNPGYPDDCYYDPSKNCWFIPEDWKEPWIEFNFDTIDNLELQ